MFPTRIDIISKSVTLSTASSELLKKTISLNKQPIFFCKLGKKWKHNFKISYNQIIVEMTRFLLHVSEEVVKAVTFILCNFIWATIIPSLHLIMSRMKFQMSRWHIIKLFQDIRNQRNKIISHIIYCLYLFYFYK